MKFYVVEGLPEDAVVGSASMAEMKARPDYAKKEFYLEGVDGKRGERGAMGDRQEEVLATSAKSSRRCDEEDKSEHGDVRSGEADQQ